MRKIIALEILCFMIFPLILSAQGTSFSRNGCPQRMREVGWVWGGILGAAGGAAAGYGTGHARDRKGARGKIGQEGPGFEFNTTLALQFSFNNLIVQNGLLYRVELINPAGGLLISMGVNLGTPSGINILTIPAPIQKLEGTYLLRLVIEAPSSVPTALGMYLINGVPMKVVPGFKDPTVEHPWVQGEEVYLFLNFPLC